jgi:hypothetical protein
LNCMIGGLSYLLLEGDASSSASLLVTGFY